MPADSDRNKFTFVKSIKNETQTNKHTHPKSSPFYFSLVKTHQAQQLQNIHVHKHKNERKHAQDVSSFSQLFYFIDFAAGAQNESQIAIDSNIFDAMT